MHVSVCVCVYKMITIGCNIRETLVSPLSIVLLKCIIAMYQIILINVALLTA